jgi:putative flippase GtrA
VLVVDRYKALNRSTLGVRMTRYTLGSLVAAATSAVVFAVLYALGASTNVCSVSAFVAGAIPNWILNRRWAWRLRGRVAVGREVFAYIAVAAVTLFLSSESTAWTQRHVQSVSVHPGIRLALVTASYLAVFGVLFVSRFALYERWIFSGRSLGATVRARLQTSAAGRGDRGP